jgi:signal transducing adaptor molecule
MSQNHSQPAFHGLFQVKVLYDFPGYEAGELRLSAGDVVDVIDATTFKDWWKGQKRDQIGIFPCNYVDLIPSAHIPEDVFILANRSKIVEFNGLAKKAVEAGLAPGEQERLQKLHSEIMPLWSRIVKCLQESKKVHDQLLQSNDEFQRAIAKYHRLMEQSFQGNLPWH